MNGHGLAMQPCLLQRTPRPSLGFRAPPLQLPSPGLPNARWRNELTWQSRVRPVRSSTSAVLTRPKTDTKWKLDDVFASALVVGTGVGGGFLAVPYTTAAAGCLPSSLLMVGLWSFILAQAFIVVDVIISASKKAGRPVSFATVAGETFGPMGAAGVCGLFLMLMLLTHVSQFAKGGELLASMLHLPYAAGVLLVAAGLSGFAQLGPARVVTCANTMLTVGFMAAVSALFTVGAPLMQWDRLTRCDWGACADQMPAVLQILIFLEVLPTVCRTVNFDRARARRVLVVGALILLSLNLGWSILGMGLVAWSGGSMSDPVEVLLQTGGAISGVLKVLSLCAISTTVVGTNLSLQSFFNDAPGSRNSWRLRGLLNLLAIAGPVLLAVSSPDIFFKALGLQGAYPLTILWGCLPPLIAVATGVARRSRKPRLKKALCSGLFAASATSLSMRLFNDIQGLQILG
mmetsp:Transcript_6987/g.16509  ORF Transcript_6987/g.16509 Transcript_6987/m.16509 type:complete len:459 (-) Transcript_6987:69-1445(-)